MNWEWPNIFRDTANDKRNQRTQVYDRRFETKSYTFPSGRVVQVQGAEDKALDKLLQTYKESDLVVGDSEIERCVGVILYKGLDGKQKRYYPDIFIRSENMIVEVKSSYTYKVHEKTNKLKEAASIASGHRFKFMIL